MDEKCGNRRKLFVAAGLAAACAVVWGLVASLGKPVVVAKTGFLSAGLLDPFPLWALLLLTVTSIVVSIRIGALIGRGRQEKEGPVGVVVATALGLLAFMLAFTFGIAANHFDARRRVLLDEVESIGTTYLRAGLLPHPQGDEIRRCLRRYVDIRLDAVQHPSHLSEALRESEQLHDRMWTLASEAVNAGNKTAIDALFISSLNNTIDLHTRRTVFVQYRVPDIVWMVLLATSVITMMMVGYMFGLSKSSSWLIIVSLAVVFAAIIALTSDLDRPAAGILRVSQQPMIELQRSMRASQAPPTQ